MHNMYPVSERVIFISKKTIHFVLNSSLKHLFTVSSTTSLKQFSNIYILSLPKMIVFYSLSAVSKSLKMSPPPEGLTNYGDNSTFTLIPCQILLSSQL